MSTDYHLYHPYRFERLAKELAERSAAIGSTSLSDEQARAEYSGLSDAEFSKRLEDYNRVGWFRQQWVLAGREILDLSDLQAAETHVEVLPKFDPGQTIYLHFGENDQLPLPGLPGHHVEGVYLTAEDVDGRQGSLVLIVGSLGKSSGQGFTVGGRLIDQSRVAMGFISQGALVDPQEFDGDLSVCNPETILSTLSRVSYVLANNPRLVRRVEGDFRPITPGGRRQH